MSWHTPLDLGWGGMIKVDDEVVTYTFEDVYEGGKSSKLDF